MISILYFLFWGFISNNCFDPELFDNKDWKTEISLLAIINNPNTDKIEKINLQLDLIKLYTNQETHRKIRDHSKALNLAKNIIANPDAPYEIKMDMQFLLIDLLSGSLQGSSVWGKDLDYICAINLCKEIMQDTSLSYVDRIYAQLKLARFYTGSIKTPSLQDIDLAKELIIELIMNTEVKNKTPDISACAHLMLADILSGFYASNEFPSSTELDFQQAISLYCKVAHNIECSKIFKYLSNLGLAFIYLFGPDELYEYDKGMCYLRNAKTNGTLYGNDLLVKYPEFLIAEAQASYDGATQEEIEQSINECNKLLREDFSATIKNELKLRLQRIKIRQHRKENKMLLNRRYRLGHINFKFITTRFYEITYLTQL